MQKYLTKMMFNINVDNGTDSSQFDEQVRIVESHTLEEAFQKARNIGKKEQETFLNSENQLVSWQFIDVYDVYPLESIKDGEQVYSNTHKIHDNQSYIKYIRQKSMEIQVKNLTFV
jgi:hypothetical protein